MTAAPGSERISILLADDHAILRETLRESLEAEPDFLVVDDVGNGMAAVAAAAVHRPGVVLLDIDMPGLPVALTVQRLREVSPQTRVVILSMYDCASFVQELLHFGVRGYVSKGVSRQHLVSVIRAAVNNDQAVLISVSPESVLPPVGDPVPGLLSDRERSLLQLVAQALSNRQIATKLGITEATVKRHLYNIFAKLGAGSRIDAVNKAVAAGLIAPTSSRRPPLPRAEHGRT